MYQDQFNRFGLLKGGKSATASVMTKVTHILHTLWNVHNSELFSIENNDEYYTNITNYHYVSKQTGDCRMQDGEIRGENQGSHRAIKVKF